MSETKLGGTFPDYANMDYGLGKELDVWGRAIWGEELDETGVSNWWRVTEIGGVQIGGTGAITNGKDYFTLSAEKTGLIRLDITPEGELFGTTRFYRSTETGELVRGERIVFF